MTAAKTMEQGRLRRVVTGRSATGLLLGWGAFLISLSPSLLPRPWLLQAAASAVSTLVAYAAGALLGALLSPVCTALGLSVRVAPERRRRAVVVAASLVTTLTIAAWIAGHRGRVQTARLVGIDPPTWAADLRAFGAACLLAAGLLFLTWLFTAAVRASRFILAHTVPRPIAAALALVLVLAGTAWVTQSVVLSRTLDRLSGSAAQRDRQTPAGLSAPTSPLISGGPGSTQSWADLGRQGEIFTAHTPLPQDISEVTGRPARQPIRVYASPAGSSVDVEEVAATVVRELDRTGAFDRPVLALIGTTGTGWVDEFNVESVEYLTDGDCATAAMQYSFLPSPVAFVTDRELPKRAGRALVAAVECALAARPAASRPRLYLGGESLGSFGMQAAFRDSADMVGRVAGAVWVGTPGATTVWDEVTADRHRGSPQIAPVIDNGRHIRFATRPEDLRRDVYGRDLGSWARPRIVYLQHASDPIVWWQPSLAYREPDWIGERAGADVDPALRWWPLVTFWMIGLDLTVGNNAAPGHGHIYQDDLVDAWAAVLDVPLIAQERTAIVDAIRQAQR